MMLFEKKEVCEILFSDWCWEEWVKPPLCWTICFSFAVLIIFVLMGLMILKIPSIRKIFTCDFSIEKTYMYHRYFSKVCIWQLNWIIVIGPIQLNCSILFSNIWISNYIKHLFWILNEILKDNDGKFLFVIVKKTKKPTRKPPKPQKNNHKPNYQPTSKAKKHYRHQNKYACFNSTWFQVTFWSSETNVHISLPILLS